jgi:fructuronate reductase
LPRVLPLVVAGWLHYLGGRDEQGRKLEIADAMLGLMKPFLDAGGSDARLALSVHSFFGEMATAHAGIVGVVQSNLDGLRAHGVRATITRVLREAAEAR